MFKCITIFIETTKYKSIICKELLWLQQNSVWIEWTHWTHYLATILSIKKFQIELLRQIPCHTLPTINNSIYNFPLQNTSQNWYERVQQ